MAEEFLRDKRFAYNQTSNLVLQREGPAPREHEPSGEPETLAGRGLLKMGDRVTRDIPKEIREALEKKKRSKETGEEEQVERKQKKARSGLHLRKGETVLSETVTETQLYNPTTRQTRQVYEQMLNGIQKLMGDQPHDVLRGAADELLASLKAENLRDSERKRYCEEVLGQMSEEDFAALYRLSKSITDFQPQQAAAQRKGVEAGDIRGDLDDPTGVAVVFDEDDEEEEGDRKDGALKYVDEDEEEDDEDMEKTGMEDLEDGEGRAGRDGFQIKAGRLHWEEDEEEEEGMGGDREDPNHVDVSQIDAHWLQRELAKLLGEVNIAVATEKEILQILPTPDLQECENRLVTTLKYDNFDFAKKLLRNRWKVLYCTRLKQAQSKQEREALMTQMADTPEGQQVLKELEQIHVRRDKEKEFARNVRKEAQNLQASGGRGREEDEEVEEALAMQARASSAAAAAEEGGTLSASGEDKRPSQLVDLEGISFEKGGHLMANAKCKLPEGSYRLEKKGYDEVHVKASKGHVPDEDTLVQISSLPEWAQPAFKVVEVSRLNPVQSAVFETAFKQYEENMLICAPTGSGKTNVAMLTMLNVIGQYRLKGGGLDLAGFKIIYISPMKALVAEQVLSFSQRLEPYGISVRELTGDINLTREQIAETQVIVTTPEKWDIVTRKAGERAFTQLVRLVIIDEVHLLHDSRGPVLESIIARTVRNVETTKDHVRLVGLSATLPNYRDVALFMRVDPERGLYYFGGEYRPVPLEQCYVGIKDKKAIRRLKTMNEVVYEKVMDVAGVSQGIVFVHSRKETAKTAKMIRETALENDRLGKFLQEDSASREVLATEAEAIRTPELKELLPYGFGIHHAGLPRTDRKLVEDLFADRHIKLLVSTATLAWGVNLPAHTVIIKGTQVYMPEKGAWCELSPMDVMQMMGRAGRPQFDTRGHGIIITSHSELQFYLSLNNQQLPIESQMIGVLPDMLNAEIVLGSVQSRAEAVQWLAYTYLYVRMLSNPQLYGVSEDETERDQTLLQRRVDLAHTALALLDKHGLCRYDKRTGQVQATPLGRVASHFYLKHPTIAAFNQHLKPWMSDIELLRLFTLASEFRSIPVREEEKIELAKLMERVPVPLKGGVDEPSSKCNVLLQAYISKLKLEGFALMSDMVYVEQSGGRIMRAIFEICLRRGWASLARRALQFCKMIDKRMWATMTPLRQFKGVPDDLLRKIEKKDFAWEKYYDLTSAEIGEFIKLPKMGKAVHRLIHCFPRLELGAYVQPLTRSTLHVELTITPDFHWDQKIHGASESFWIFVEDCDAEHILHHELFTLREKGCNTDHVLVFTVPLLDPLPPNYFIRVVSDRWLSSETVLPVSFRSLILPEKNPPPTELLDLQPLPVSALRFPLGESLYEGTQFFNPVQTQVFSVAYNSNQNFLLCAPANAGKTVCAAFAILRMLKNDNVHRAVYIAPYERTAVERFKEWEHKFGKGLGLKVSMLTGDKAADIRVLEESNIVVCTPDKFDYMTRQWRRKRVISQIRVLIVDELQLLSSEVDGSGAGSFGPAHVEVCVSRMRFITGQTQQPIRLVGMACSVANARDLGEWMGVGQEGLFNFGPHVRTVPLEVVVNGFEIPHRASRLLAMGKPLYNAIRNFAKDRPAIVFVSDRKQARVAALDLLHHAIADRRPAAFLSAGGGQRGGDTAIKQVALLVREKALKQSLEYGVGFIHEGLSEFEREKVEALYSQGLIQVLVCTQPLSWGMTLTANLVVIQDTLRLNGREGIFEDYPITDVLQMVGRATRPGIDKSGTVVLQCPGRRREFYKKFLHEPLPVESKLDHRIAEHFNAEVMMETIENKQDCVDWLTWTFYYRRLSKNPNFYGLQGVSHQHLSDHLSDLVETSVETLEQAQCVQVSAEQEISILNLGLISCFYFVSYQTIELFNKSLTMTTKRRALLEILSAANEFDVAVPIRPGEGPALKALASSLQNAPARSKAAEADELNEPRMKTLLLLQAHFERADLTADMQSDLSVILQHAVRLLHAMCDVISSNSWLRPCLLAMELAQFVVQAVPNSQAVLAQLPHFGPDRIEKAKGLGVHDVYDLGNMEDDERGALLSGLSEGEVEEVATACNRYPVVSVSFAVEVDEEVTKTSDETEENLTASAAPAASCSLLVKIDRDIPDDGTEGAPAVGPVYAPFYPKEKEEKWWLVVGVASKDGKDAGTENSLLAIKSVPLNKESTKAKLDFDAPEEAGEYECVLYLMCDSYVGCDRENTFVLKVD
uniref:Uncharacterized protein n=1 Tax=Chromera velia CCMP2878 TaxID=1169474 RepID=A0A0G4G6Z2_9ALVE|eukprot:Cvel_20444.t1-p1 / transcript=Cvel_20444.t1 / gene=Cvel_20444 / organism=Chromera_velia_CCMP2878 / gene_product=U5 small nuclear ribonucleoprotein 200 kDa helicase, putative / transcript_product=U5 small nuclear ribonucleoprotein 200 kDa helicase, putative / location=Cvel_scaffold1833:13036-30484(-) / protein_length=2252 / sequence_SO=supercontig / SO=protein_coding / is_pseudo=false